MKTTLLSRHFLTNNLIQEPVAASGPWTHIWVIHITDSSDLQPQEAEKQYWLDRIVIIKYCSVLPNENWIGMGVLLIKQRDYSNLTINHSNVWLECHIMCSKFVTSVRQKGNFENLVKLYKIKGSFNALQWPQILAVFVDCWF